MDRNPFVAGQFYPGDSAAIAAELDIYLVADGEPREAPLLSMVPHAGWVYSGAMCGQTLAAAPPRQRLIVMCPNHVGRGIPLAVWPDGNWNFPGGSVAVDEELAGALVNADNDFHPNYDAHQGEHSLEVVVPFLHRLNPETSIVPVSVALNSLEALARAGRALAQAIAQSPEPVGMVVSSDMSHMISGAEAKRLDSMAIEAILALDPEGLYDTVCSNGITMCGVLPMTLGMFAALELGATSAELAGYCNSGDVTGDQARVVGYAGLTIR